MRTATTASPAAFRAGRAKAIRLGDYSIRVRGRTIAALAAILVALAGAVAWTVSTGSFPLAPDRLWAALNGAATPAEEFIVWRIRLPRLATALAVGACLGLSGAIFQTLTRNPLGSPDILGLTQGASSGALVAIVFLSGASTTVVAGSAAVGALGAGLVIYLLTRGTDPSGYRLVLIGIGVSAILAGVNGYLLTRSDIIDASRAVFWLTGDLSDRNWDQAATVASVLVVGGIAAAVLARGLEAMRLGEATATGLGVDVGSTRVAALITASVLAAGGVAVSGPLAFVALAAPHIAARLTRSGRSFIGAMLVGALLVTAADAAAVSGIGERQLPTGVVTGVVGGVYLMWLLVIHRKKGVMS
ncbi:FecCD family ABC transporter permease [Glycomyces salinus]|uniref:FecCD family ABC transporter permease n=1 Tax=Glycomyces salinus TaxID=980294 RepID=UPI0018EE110A|nr:iron chelate uptake ABC transporter family permease subunit [Glycomyces salinus]